MVDVSVQIWSVVSDVNDDPRSPNLHLHVAGRFSLTVLHLNSKLHSSTGNEQMTNSAVQMRAGRGVCTVPYSSNMRHWKRDSFPFLRVICHTAALSARLKVYIIVTRLRNVEVLYKTRGVFLIKIF